MCWHLMLVTQESSMYKNEVEQSRKDVHAHFGQEGTGFQNILPIPRFYRGFRVLCVRVHSTL